MDKKFNWEEVQQNQIDKAVALIKQYGNLVQFVVGLDKKFFLEQINPLVNIDRAQDYIHRYEERGITLQEVNTFKKEYVLLIQKITDLETLAVKYLANTEIKNTNYFPLNKKIKMARRKSKK